MTENLNLIHERVDDIPFLIGLMVHLHLPELIDSCLGNHGNHQGLSTGWLITIWLAYILSHGDHRKSTVQDWVERHRQTLEQLVGQPIRDVELNDDRLGIVLHRLSKTPAWERLETVLWQSTVTVYSLGLTRVRLDSTTAYGYHTPHTDGIMRYGQSKDERPDLPQLKLMAAAAEPAGHLVACDVHPGQKGDDPLYVPLIQRVRLLVGQTGLLYLGDAKMSALATRADIVAHGDYYLVPLAACGGTVEQQAAWIERAVATDQMVELFWADKRLLGAGYEFQRAQTAQVDGQSVHWDERVQVIRSPDGAREQARHLTSRVNEALADLAHLTPPLGQGRGHRRYTSEEEIQAAVSQILQRYAVSGLLRVRWQREEQTLSHAVGRGRRGPQHPAQTDVRVRYVLTTIERDEDAIQARIDRLGWHIHVTNVPIAQVTTDQAVLIYRGGWCLERDFHLLKDRPLGISPLYVWRDDQIIGLTRLLTVAARLLTLIETQVRADLARRKEALSGLYAGQPTRTTNQPTATRLLTAFARAEITLTRIETGNQTLWHITPLSAMLERVLTSLGLSVALYTRLAENSP